MRSSFKSAFFSQETFSLGKATCKLSDCHFSTLYLYLQLYSDNDWYISEETTRKQEQLEVLSMSMCILIYCGDLPHPFTSCLARETSARPLVVSWNIDLYYRYSENYATSLFSKRPKTYCRRHVILTLKYCPLDLCSAAMEEREQYLLKYTKVVFKGIHKSAVRSESGHVWQRKLWKYKET